MALHARIGGPETHNTKVELLVLLPEMGKHIAFW